MEALEIAQRATGPRKAAQPTTTFSVDWPFSKGSLQRPPACAVGSTQGKVVVGGIWGNTDPRHLAVCALQARTLHCGGPFVIQTRHEVIRGSRNDGPSFLRGRGAREHTHTQQQ